MRRSEVVIAYQRKTLSVRADRLNHGDSPPSSERDAASDILDCAGGRPLQAQRGYRAEAESSGDEDLRCLHDNFGDMRLSVRMSSAK